MPNDLTDAQLASIIRLAEKATPGPWHLEHCDDWMAMNMYAVVDDPKLDYDMAGNGRGESDHVIALTLYQADAGLATHKDYQENTAFIAACDPQTILAAMKELQRRRAGDKTAKDSR